MCTVVSCLTTVCHHVSFALSFAADQSVSEPVALNVEEAVGSLVPEGACASSARLDREGAAGRAGETATANRTHVPLALIAGKCYSQTDGPFIQKQ